MENLCLTINPEKRCKRRIQIRPCKCVNVQLNKQMHRQKRVNLHRQMIKQTYRVTHKERSIFLTN